jgi:hypothetical protein
VEQERGIGATKIGGEAQRLDQLRSRGSLPLPSRWLAAGAVQDQVLYWLSRKDTWESRYRDWQPGGKNHRDLAALQELEASWPGQETVIWNTRKITRKEFDELKFNAIQHRDLILGEIPLPPGPFWAVLTPQGPILVQAPEDWALSLEGGAGLLKMHRMGWELLAERPSLVEVLQVEPLEGAELIQAWVPWVSLCGDLYVIP